MFLKKYIDSRVKVVKSILSEPSGTTLMVQSDSYVNVPFDVDGTPLEIMKKVPFKPIEASFKSFNNDFMLSTGQVNPIKTFRNDLANVVSQLTSAQVLAMLNPAPAETKSEN